jgi:hypothetical protein
MRIRSLDEKVINWTSEDAMPMAARASAMVWLVGWEVRRDWLTWFDKESLMG